MSENGENGNGNVTEHVVSRDANGRWLPGTSPNPNGKRGNGRIIIRDILKLSQAQEALDLLMSHLKHEDGFVAQGAARFIIEQYFGKAKQAVEITGEDGGPIQVEEYRNEMRQRIDRILGASQPRSIPEAN